MMRLAALLCLVIVLACGSTDAAGEPTAGYEHLKFLEPLIGTWVMEMDAPQDYPEHGVKKGDKLYIYNSYEWCTNKNGILLRGYATSADGSAEAEWAVTLIGWDHVARKIVANRLGDKTGWSQPVWQKTDDGWVVKSVKTDPDGVRVGRDAIIKLAGEKMMIRHVNRFRGDEKLEDSDLMEFTKKK
jgi:hypothetical protein